MPGAPDRLSRRLALAIGCALAPPAVIALWGGADVSLLTGQRLGWFEAAPSAAALGLALLLAAAPAAGRAARALRWLALLLLASAAAVLWTGGVDSEWFSLRRPGRPTVLAALCTLGVLALGRGGSWPRRDRWLPGLLATAGVSALLVLGVALRDRQVFEARLDAPAAAPVASAAAQGASAADAVERPDVLLVLADTLRADALGSFAGEPGRTPFLDAWAGELHAFDAAWSQAAWTVPSVASLFTSLHPSSVDPHDGEILRTCGFAGFRLPPQLPTLASRLRAHGYRTLGFQKNPLLRPGTGFEQGFDVYDVVGGDRAEGEAARHMTDAVLRAARRLAARRTAGDARPLFVYAHYMDPHLDYSPPRGYRPDRVPGGSDLDGRARVVQAAVRRPGGPSDAEVARMRALYAAEVRYLDDQLRRLVEGLRALSLFGEDAVVVFLSDHGEQFGEHGQFEHCDIHRENLRVPLLIGGPGVVPGRSREPVRLLDVKPTLLELAGIPAPDSGEGRSLVPLLRGQPLQERVAISEHKRGYRVSAGDHALLLGKAGEQLFDVAADPGETRDLLAERPEVAEALRQALQAHRARTLPEAGPAAEALPLDRETREALRALGYLE